MEPAGVERRLAAIMAADVVGYSRLMALDEVGTHTRLKKLREQIIEPIISEHQGRIVKLLGDGALIEFSSVVNAVECAVTIQRRIGACAADMPEEQRIGFRIGVNLGDVIIDGDDIYGDGVNIAARLEALAKRGGIVVSGTAFDHARNKAQVGFRFLGEQHVKNIPEPVRAYQVLLNPADIGTVEGKSRFAPRFRQWHRLAAVTSVILVFSVAAAALLWVSSEPQTVTGTTPSQFAGSVAVAGVDVPKPSGLSIAVLPFDNMDGTPAQDYFSDGISEDIITDLSRISSLRVISRRSSFRFREDSVDVRHVAGELGVRYVLEGSVRRSGDQIRINAQLIDGATGAHVWAERYDRPTEGIFAVQDDITQQIVQALHVELTQAEHERIARRYTADIEAYDDYLLARSFRADVMKERAEEARRLLEKAIDRDPNFAAAFAELSWLHHVSWERNWSGEDAKDLAFDLAKKAVALDDLLPEGHARLAWAYLWRGQYEEAIASGRRAIEIDPNYADGYLLLSHTLIYAGEAEEGVEIATRGIPLDPDSMYHSLMHLADGQRLLGQHEEAIANLRKAIEIQPGFEPGYTWLAAIYGNLGRVREAQEAAAEVMRLNPLFSISGTAKFVPYRDTATLDQFLDGLREAGLPEHPRLP